MPIFIYLTINKDLTDLGVETLVREDDSGRGSRGGRERLLRRRDGHGVSRATLSVTFPVAFLVLLGAVEDDFATRAPRQLVSLVANRADQLRTRLSFVHRRRVSAHDGYIQYFLQRYKYIFLFSYCNMNNYRLHIFFYIYNLLQYSVFRTTFMRCRRCPVIDQSSVINHQSSVISQFLSI